MSKNNITIDNEKDLVNLLKVIAEEASLKSLIEYDDSFESKYSDDVKRYGSLSEQPEEDDVEAFSPEDAEATEEPPEEPTDEPESPEDDVDELPILSYASVKSAINDMRAGKSLKTDEVDENLSAYYEELDENERLVLQHYLQQVAQIINLSLRGDDAKEPSDPPLNITMTTAEEDADEEAAAAVETEEVPQDTDTEEEDTTPPIQVAENKNYNDESFRKHIRSLMER